MYETELKIALAAARESGKIFKTYYGKPKQIRAKGGDYRNIVTEADCKIEDLIYKKIHEAFPDHSFLGEEKGIRGQQEAAFQWVVDPIDGTTNFAQGIPYCCISIALLKNSQIVIGVVYNPILEDMYYAVVNEGTYRNKDKLKVHGANSLERAFCSLGWGKNFKHGSKFISEITKKVMKARVLGSHALSMCGVASGQFDAFIASGGDVHIWDIAAATLIVEQAKGITTNLDNKKILPGTNLNQIICSGNNLLHKKTIKFLKQKVV